MKHETQERIQISEPEVIYEDGGFVAINKPSGMLVHETWNMKRETPNSVGKLKKKFNDSRFKIHDSKETTLVDWILERYPEVRTIGDPSTSSGQVTLERSGIVHRLDKDTSGVILVAKTQEYFEYLKKLFGEHKIKKTYLALVYGSPKEKKGRIDKPIALKPGTTKRSVHGGKMIKEALTEYELVRNIKYQITNNKKGENEISLLRVMPKTGRTHQIRVHLASIGCPVLNDAIYAPKKEKVGTGRLMLHALSVKFTSKEGRKVFIESELPKEFRI